jgi:hypothetical protein
MQGKVGRKQMSEHEVLSLDELFELASFEVLGLLDPVDLVRFERGFAASAPSVQAEIIGLQERMARDPIFRDTTQDAILGSGSVSGVGEPSASLRLRTLARVIEAIETESASAKPIATIGPVSRAVAVQVSEGQSTRGSSAITAESMRDLISDLSARNRESQAPTQLVWRAASFILLAALIVSMFFNIRLTKVSETLADATMGQALETDAIRLAAEYSGFDFASSRHVDLVPVGGARVGHVSVFLDEKNGRVAVHGIGFNPNEIVEIVLLDEAGKILASSQFTVAASSFGGLWEAGSAAIAAGRIQIRGSASVGSADVVLYTQA